MVIRDELQINSHPDDVWAVTIDLSKSASWSPTIDRIRALENFEVGIGSQYELKQPGQPKVVWTVTQLNPKSLFVWERSAVGMNMRAIHHVDAVSDGALSTLILETSGFLAFILAPMLERIIAHALKQENAGLKAYCETHYPLS